MTKQQENRAFVKMLKEFPKAFGRVSFRERLMLRTAFTYVIEEVIADIKANCDFALEGKDVEIKELKDHLVKEVELHLHAEDYIKELEQQIEQMQDAKCTSCTELGGMQLKINRLEKENAELKELIKQYRQAVDKCLHITFMGGGCEVNTISQYATLVDGYLTDVEGLAKWKN